MPAIFCSLPPYFILLNIRKYNKTKAITLELKETNKEKETSPRRCEDQTYLFTHSGIPLDSQRPESE